jgi:DNA ligase (NAD+)
MIKIKTLEQYRSHIRQANVWSYEYYHLDNPTVEDWKWDSYYNAIKAFEEENPNLISKFSPTQNVGWSRLLEANRLAIERGKP